MAKHLRVAGIVKESIVDGPGIRYVVFAQGCKHKCLGCHNPDTHSFEGGSLIEIDTICKQIKSNPLLDGVTLSGGEPFEQATEFAILAQKIKEMNLDVMIYTGYTYEEIVTKSNVDKDWSKLLGHADKVVDGRFVENKKDYKLKFKGSDNQRIIDLKQTRLSGRIALATL